MTTVIAHVSDTHFGGPPEARDRAERLLAHLDAMSPRPDLLLVSGDIADHGTAEEYAEARAVLDAWTGPLALATGNHDVRSEFVRGLLDREADGPVLHAVDGPGCRVLVLDSLVDAVDGQRQDHGVVGPDQLDWLDRQLAGDARPAFVSLHHPPVDIGLELMAPILLRDPAPLAEVVSRHDHVVAILVGHAHTACTTTFAGRPVLIGGGSASTVTMDAEPVPRIWEAAPPTLALHLLHDDGRLTTHWRAL
jgi:3',5'-cyclic-AMP phosphodiesterase